MASFTVMAGAVSACFMPRLMVCASLYACSICWSLFHRRVLIRTVTVRGVRSNIAVIIIVVYTLRVQRYNKSRKVPNFPPDKYPLWCVSKSKNDMVPFGRNPKSALSEQRSSDQQMGGEQQDERCPRGAEGVNGSVHVHCCFINCLYLIQYIGLAHHKRKPPSTSFGMSRRILS